MKRIVLDAVIIYQYIFFFAVFIYTVSWRYKKDYLHASIDFLLLQSSLSLMHAVVLATPFQAIVSKYLQSGSLRGRQYSLYLCKERNMRILHCSANGIQDGWFTKPAWKSTETACTCLSHINTFDYMENKFKEFPFWLWDRNSLQWHQSIRIKLPN